MNSIKLLFVSFFFFTALSISTPDLLSQAVVTPPAVKIEWGNHTIEKINVFDNKGLVFVDDGSVWELNPEDLDWVSSDKDRLVGIPITLMSDASEEDLFPFRIIVHNEDSDYGWKDLTVQIKSGPENQNSRHIEQVDEQEGRFVVISLKGENAGTEGFMAWIYPYQAERIKRWKPEQKVIIGGVWFPEYDAKLRVDYTPAFPFVMYNYDTGEHAFFDIGN